MMKERSRVKLTREVRERLHGAGRIFEQPYIGSVNQPTKERSLRHCVYTEPVSEVYDVRRVRMVPNLL